ncbi:unnamed protein product, partial [marine sediment metagenome]
MVHADVDGDGAKEIVLENAFLKVTIEPSSGGRVARVVYKPAGVDLACFGPYRGERPGGLFGDRITTQSYPGDYLDTTAEATILEQTPERVRVRLKSRGRAGPASNLFIEKEFELVRGRSSLGIAAAMSYVTGKTDPSDTVRTGLWWQHILRVGKVGTQTGFRCRYFIPLTTGILSLPFVPQGRNSFKRDNGYMRNPARGWIGTVAYPGGDTPPVGAAFTLDYAKLLHYYICMDPGMLAYPTLEWYYQRVTLRDGDSFSTKALLTPCRGLQEITGSRDGLTGELRFEQAKPTVGQALPVHIGLASDRTRRVTVELADRLLTWHTGRHTTRVVGTKTLSLEADTTVHVAMPMVVKSPGTHVAVVRVLGTD